LALVACLGVSLFAAENQPVRLLTIGNSFSASVFRNLQAIAKDEGCDLLMRGALIGGCSLERHMNEYRKSLADPNYKPYGWNSGGKKKNLVELLTEEKWDYVTIQQVSHQSWDPKSYHPHVDQLIDIIKHNAPQAEILIQQTWAYRSDDPRLNGHGSWKFDQQGMYERLTANYTQLSKDTGFPLIPVGKAVQIARQNQPHHFVASTPEEIESLVYPDLPKAAWCLAGNQSWRKDKKTGELKISIDRIHLNRRGEYLQATVWFGFLFKRDPQTIKFEPKELGRSDAVFLRKCAAEALN
jgi:hypothetical protein